MIEKIAAVMAIPMILTGAPSNQIVLSNSQAGYEVVRAAAEDEDEAVYFNVSFDENTSTEKNAEGVKLMTASYKLPVIGGTGNQIVIDKINAYYKKVKEDFAAGTKELTSYAASDYKLRDKETLKDWTGYETSMKYESKRTDDAVISLVREYYENTGGAHPNTAEYAENFSAFTGETLTLKDIVKDEKDAKKAIADYIEKEIRKSDYKDSLFEGYEKSIPELITDNTWYLSDEGLVIIINEYIIGPHALGIKEITIPYEHISFLKNAYQK